MCPDSIGHLIVGPDEHGVLRFGRDLIAAMGATGAVGPVVQSTAAALLRDLEAELAPLTGAVLVHTQYTDRLFGARCEASAELFTTVGAVLARRGSGVSATLHDLPIVPPAGAPVDPLALRRTAAYRRVASACAGVVVNSRHEQERLAAILGGACPPVTVIPLPVDPPADRRPDPRPVRNVAVLGFLYPGKGHDEVLRAVAALPPEIMMTALGRPSDGHEDLAGELQQLARSLHRTLEVTGFVPDAELPAALHAAGVPVAPHRTVSASGSIATWLGAGRRPLVPDVAYTRELEQRCPGALWLYPPDAAGLTGCLLAAVAHPEQTWLGEVAVGPSTVEVAAAYAAALAGWS